MKITHILECAGGVARYLEMLALRLKKEGIEQSIVCSHSVHLDKLKDSAEACYVTDILVDTVLINKQELVERKISWT